MSRKMDIKNWHCGEPKPRAKRGGGTTVRVAIQILLLFYEIATITAVISQ